MNEILPTIVILIVVLGALGLILSRRRARQGAIPELQAAVTARQAVGSVRNILVPTVGTEYSERGVEIACRAGQNQKATIHLLYVVVIPRSLPLGNPMPDEETKARTALARAESIVRSHGLPCTTWVERARSAGEGIIHRAKILNPNLMVVGMRPSYGPEESLLGRTTDALLREAPCEVIVDKMPSEGRP